MQRTDKTTLNLLFIIFVLFGVAYTLIDPLIPLISEKLSLGYDKIGLYLFASSSISLVAIFISGRLSDRYSLRKIIFTGLVILFSGFFIYGIYFSLAVFIATIILFKAGCGILDSSIHAYAAKIFYGKHSSIFIKLDLFWYIGAIIGPLLISSVLFLNINPRYAFLVFSVIAFIITLLFLRYCKEQKQCLTEQPDGNEKEDNYDRSLTGSKKAHSSQGIIKIYISIIKNPIIIFSCTGLFFYIGIFTVLSTWLTTYFASLNIAVSYGSMILSVFWAFNALGVILTGKILSRTNEASLLLIYSIVGAASAIMYAIVPNAYIKIIFLILQAIFYSCFFPLLNALAVQEDLKLSGTILGVTISVSATGLVVFQPLSGYMMEYFGTEGINYLIIISAIALFISVLLLFMYSAKRYKIFFKSPLKK